VVASCRHFFCKHPIRGKSHASEAASTLFFVIAVLLLLPLLYAGSYVAMLRPDVAFELVPVEEPARRQVQKQEHPFIGRRMPRPLQYSGP
jgi:hypothetical protein